MLPTFETDRLLIRPRTIADFGACLAMDRDADVVKYVAGPWADPAEHERFLSDRIQRNFGNGLGYWSIFERHGTKAFLGWVLLIPYDGIGPRVEIGWRLNRAAWGKGYATEAAFPFVRYSFESIKLPEIVADIHPNNVASLRVVEKIGMRLVGEIEHDGVPLKSFLLTAGDYDERLAACGQAQGGIVPIA